MLAAARRSDLDAARKCGLRAGFIHRPEEFGPARQTDTAEPGEFDIVASGMRELAILLGTGEFEKVALP